MGFFKNSTESAPPPSPKTITDLPLELILKILQQVSCIDTIQCKKSCRKLYHVGEKYSRSLERPWVRMDFTAALKSGTPMVLVKFCRTNSKQGAPYIFGLYEADGKIELGWTKGESPKRIILNGKESWARSGNKSLAPPAQVSKLFMEEVTTMPEAIRRLLRAHLSKVHVKELNFRSFARPLQLSEVDCIRQVMEECHSRVDRVHFGQLDPFYKNIISFTKCRELAARASKQMVEILELDLPKILIYGEAGITVNLLIAFIEQWESSRRQITEFRWISDLDVTEIRSRLRALSSFVNEESSRTFLCRGGDRQQVVINIEHNSLQMYTK